MLMFCFCNQKPNTQNNKQLSLLLSYPRGKKMKYQGLCNTIKFVVLIGFPFILGFKIKMF